MRSESSPPLRIYEAFGASGAEQWLIWEPLRELEEHFPECKFFSVSGKTGADVVENEHPRQE